MSQNEMYKSDSNIWRYTNLWEESLPNNDKTKSSTTNILGSMKRTFKVPNSNRNNSIYHKPKLNHTTVVDEQALKSIINQIERHEIDISPRKPCSK